MAEVEIGIFKSARQAYGFDDIAIVPSRRTRDPEDVDITWQIDAYKFELPVLGSAMDGAMSPLTAIELGRLGGLGVLNLEGLWTRYEDPIPLFEEIRELDDDKATARMQQMYLEPIKLELVAERIKQMKDAGVTVLMCAVRPDLMKVIDSSGLLRHLGPERVFVFQETGEVWSSTLDAIRFAYEIVGNDVCATCPRHAESLNEKEGWYYLI